MSSFDDQVRARVKALTERVGTTITYRRVTRSTGRSPAVNPTNLDAVTVQQGALAGAAQAAIGAAGWRGRLVAGDQLVFAGDATVYTLQGEVTILAGQATVDLAPVLAADITQGQAVALTYAADHTLKARIQTFSSAVRGGSLVEDAATLVVIPAASIDFEPAAGDLIVVSGRQLSVETANPQWAREKIARWDLQAR